MAATATATSVRYAPDDPTLPKPWRGLVDGKTGYLYFWNPETNVTQYEKPVSSMFAGPNMVQKSLNSLVHDEKSTQGHIREGGLKDDNDRYNSRETVTAGKLSYGTGSYQAARTTSDQPRDVSNATVVDDFSKGQSSLTAGSSLSPESYRRRHEISVTGDNVPPPIMSFDSSVFPAEILREVQLAGFSAPTPIQAQSWPIAVQGRDIVAIAKTGSGKTLGYLMPGYIHLKRRRNNPQLGPTVLVLSPTRELATQIQDEAIKFGKSSRISCTCLYGGAPKGPQLKELDRGTDIVVATPGRLNDILEMRRVSLDQVSYLVLDEADRMLDMGFEPQIRKIVKEVPVRRQTLMYTATWPKEVRKIAADLLTNPVQVNIGNVDELVANKSITQHIELLPPMEKHRRLEQILRSQEPGSKIIIFCSTKKMCDQLARNLTRQFGAAAIHGDKSQSDRDFVLNQFRNGRSPVLVATDVAARGLDIKDIRVVINYDFPTGIEDYVHRIGRTGRAGASGVAYTFFGDQDAKHASDLVKVLEGANQRVPVEIRDMASRGGGMGGRSRRWGSDSGGYDGGRGGRYDSNYGGRDGGRGGWSASYSDRGYGRGTDRDSQDSDRCGRSSHEADTPGSFHHRSFHETMTRAGENRGRSRSRSRSPNKVSGWSDNRNNGRNTERSDQMPGQGDLPITGGRSFHETMMQGVRTPPLFGNLDIPSFIGDKPTECDNGAPKSSRSPEEEGGGDGSQWRHDDRGAGQSRSQCGEEEEGMVQVEEGSGGINTSG